MATPRKSPYDKLLDKSARQFAECATALDEIIALRRYEAWAKSVAALQHWEEPVDGCVCEGCLWWDEQLRIHRSGRARN